jgi:hypothetical protein
MSAPEPTRQAQPSKIPLATQGSSTHVPGGDFREIGRVAPHVETTGGPGDGFSRPPYPSRDRTVLRGQSCFAVPNTCCGFDGRTSGPSGGKDETAAAGAVRAVAALAMRLAQGTSLNLTLAFDLAEPPMPAGRVAMEDGLAHLEWSREVIAAKRPVAALYYPPEPGLQAARGRAFEGLHGFLADSLRKAGATDRCIAALQGSALILRL